MNPYGAVPRALEGTRQTLREIMTDFVSQKLQESKLQLALGEMDLERKALELEGEKERARTAVDLSKLAMEQGYRKERLGLDKKRLAETTRHAKAAETAAEQRLGEQARHAKAMESTAQQRADILQSQEDWLNEAKTPDVWAGELGLSPTQQEIFRSYFPEGTSLSRRDVQEQVKDLKENPVMHFKFRLLGNIDRLEEMGSRLADPDLTAEDKKALEANYDTLYGKTQRLKTLVDYIDQGKTKLTPEQYRDLRDDAMLAWDTLDEGSRERLGGDYKKFEKAYVDDYTDILKKGNLNLKELKRKKTAAKPGTEDVVSAVKLEKKETKQLMDGINEIERVKGAGAADRAFAAIKRFLAQGEKEQAKDFIDIVLGRAARQGAKKEKTERKETSASKETPRREPSLQGGSGAVSNLNQLMIQ